MEIDNIKIGDKFIAACDMNVSKTIFHNKGSLKIKRGDILTIIDVSIKGVYFDVHPEMECTFDEVRFFFKKA